MLLPLLLMLLRLLPPLKRPLKKEIDTQNIETIFPLLLRKRFICVS